MKARMASSACSEPLTHLGEPLERPPDELPVIDIHSL